MAFYTGQMGAYRCFSLGSSALVALLVASCARGLETDGSGAGGAAGTGGSSQASTSTGGCVGSCDDSDECTTDTCAQGTCSHQPVAVDDSNTCTTDSCDKLTGIIHMPVNVDDNDECTTDACDPVTGVSHTPAVIDDNDACTTDSCDMVTGVSHTLIVCNDNLACTIDTCDPVTGCAFPPNNVCNNGDGCCPAGCSNANDNDCPPAGSCQTNLALTATALSSGGGITNYGPMALNNNAGEGATCYFCWVNSSANPSGAYFELDWPAAVTIGSMYIDTSGTAAGACATANRNLAGASVQYWNGAAWVTATTFSGKTNDVQLNLPAPVNTTKLRLYNVVTSGSVNALVFEWHVYSGVNCLPPP
jgi:hypothetical protein